MKGDENRRRGRRMGRRLGRGRRMGRRGMVKLKILKAHTSPF
ncbi:MAG: hypothetical protein QXV01_04110 [Candidatus Bathyarchaeia archaeon]